MKPLTSSLFAFVATLCTSSVVFAQEPVAAGPETAPQPQQAAPGLTPPATPAEAPAKEEGETRFRWGLSGYGGPLAGGLSGGAGGIDARFGAQITNMFGVAAQPVFLLGAGADASVQGASASGVALYGTGVLGEVTLADLFFVGAGPELLFGAMGSSSVNAPAGTASASASTGPYFSVAARAGLALGSMKPNRRKAFTLGLDFRTIFNPGDPVIVPCLALGYDAF